MSLTLAAPPPAAARTALPRGEITHRIFLSLAIAAVVCTLASLALHGYSYYQLALEDRPLSPLHSQLRSSGSVGLKLGMLSVGMFGVLFLYPLRKRWLWLARIGSSRRWLNFHVLFGIATPTVVTFHTAFRWHGLAGLAYWTMIAVALSGFVGRYIYAKIPRGVNAVELSIRELEEQTANLASRLREQRLFRDEVLAPLFNVPTAQQIRAMNLIYMIWTMLRLDISRLFHVCRLRRHLLSPGQRVATLGGLLAAHDSGLEEVISNVRRQARLRTAMAFLDRAARVFHLWHAIHRPFSISFVALILIHIGVALSVGF